jgi:hypothetical protein
MYVRGRAAGDEVARSPEPPHQNYSIVKFNKQNGDWRHFKLCEDFSAKIQRELTLIGA